MYKSQHSSYGNEWMQKINNCRAGITLQTMKYEISNYVQCQGINNANKDLHG